MRESDAVAIVSLLVAGTAAMRFAWVFQRDARRRAEDPELHLGDFGREMESLPLQAGTHVGPGPDAGSPPEGGTGADASWRRAAGLRYDRRDSPRGGQVVDGRAVPPQNTKGTAPPPRAAATRSTAPVVRAPAPLRWVASLEAGHQGQAPVGVVRP